MSYCKLNKNTKRRSCEITKNKDENSTQCLFNIEKNKCQVNNYANRKFVNNISQSLRKSPKKTPQNTPKKMYEYSDALFKPPLKTAPITHKIFDTLKIPKISKSKISPQKTLNNKIKRLKQGITGYKKLIDTLRLTTPSSKTFNLEKIEILPNNFLFVHEKFKPMIFDTQKFLGSGSNNNVFKVTQGDKKYAFRISKHPLLKKDIIDTVDESELTIRLSGLGITPKIYNCYFAKQIRYDSGKQSMVNVLVVVSELAINDVGNFIESKTFYNLDDTKIVDLAKQTKNLYRRMIDNDIICVDIKAGNMVVQKKSSTNFDFKNIDFDSAFCSHKSSKYSFKQILSDLRNPNKSCFISKDVSEKYVKKLFLNISLIQITLFLWKGKKQELFSKSLIDDIALKDIPDMCKIARTKIGNGDYTLEFIFRHYYRYALEHFHYRCLDKKIPIPIETSMIGSILMALFGKDYKTNHCLP